MDNDQIVSLKGPDRVRKRPAVMFGSADGAGCTYAVCELLEIFVVEAFLGFSKKLSVCLEKDGTVEILSEDRGFFIDERTVDGKPAWHGVFCDFYPAPRIATKEYCKKLATLHGVLYGAPEEVAKYQIDEDADLLLCAVQYASQWMEVESVHDGIFSFLRFEKGYPVGTVRREESASSSYTRIRFRLDGEVFDECSFSFSEISDCLCRAAVCVPGLTCCISEGENKNVFHFPRGGVDYVRSLCGDSNVPVFQNEIEATGRDRYNYDPYDARVRVFLAFTKQAGGVFCFHNGDALDGGVHLDAAKEQLSRVLSYELNMEFDRYESIANRVVLLLESQCSVGKSRWYDSHCKSIKNPMIRDMCTDLFGQAFVNFVYENQAKITSVLNGETGT